jgi:mRNA interferase RelE/StbE
MDEYQITFARSARKELEKLSSREANRIFSKIIDLTKDPRPKGCRKIVGETDLWRLRIGVFRVIYSIQDKDRVIDIVAVRHRSEAYR